MQAAARFCLLACLGRVHQADGIRVTHSRRSHRVSRRRQTPVARPGAVPLPQQAANHAALAFSVAAQEEASDAAACELPPGARWCEVRLSNAAPLFQMAVYGDDDIVSGAICMRGSWEHSEFHPEALIGVAALPKNKPAVALDVGSNIGYVTLALAASGWDRVIAVELPENNALLKASLCRNPGLRAKITLHEFGLGRENKSCAVVSDEHNKGDGIVECETESVRRDAADEAARGYYSRGSFQLKRLDDMLEQDGLLANDAISFAKLDVEGYECEVMKGGPALLSTVKPKLLWTEVWSKMQVSSCTPAEYADLYKNAGYHWMDAAAVGSTNVLSTCPAATALFQVEVESKKSKPSRTTVRVAGPSSKLASRAAAGKFALVAVDENRFRLDRRGGRARAVNADEGGEAFPGAASAGAAISNFIACIA